ncbi:hypothetical protein G7Y89_g9612 [Cudoniella acicularis]|uniref:Transport protein USO1 n=1 Tax=Cudoniella acicularis TaxID=354080 RepID=A0A8H4RGZ1_9HELO|nr:hypothetical protein G7Y89_g9612 [Cudoniella acicularis]
MPSIERDASRDSERHLKHQHSASSDTSRAIVPMWDSSDPERAPPPLPMNPSSPSLASRPNTSSAIQSAHAALTEKARESAYITNPPPKRLEASPERSLIRGAAHKRMQSLHTGNVRDLSSYLEGGSSFGSPKSPEKIANRPLTPHASKEFFLEAHSPEKSPEKDAARSTTPTQGRETPSRDLPALRPSLRRPPQSILGENTPPQSATMLALQTMASRDLDAPLSNVTNGSTALVRTPQTFDAISNQILSLTSIATSLQREMAQLSRRSKDNATDLVSLKEATNARDEDIRKSLRDLVSNLSDSGSRTSSAIYGNSALYLESKAHNSPGSRSVKPFSLPRIPSPNSFAASLDRDSIASPCPFSPDGAASIALLEKILREMGTKEGQENLISRLTEVGDRLTKDGMSTAKKIEELLQYIKNNTSQAIVPQNGGGSGSTRPRNFSFENPPRLELDFEESKSGPLTQRVDTLLAPSANKEIQKGPATTRASDIVNEDVVKIIRSVKDSVAQGGGLTAEVKALVRELRGEVLGMGREIGRKLDQASSKSASEAKDAATEKEEIASVINEGLEELRQHMEKILHESTASAIARNAVDYQEIYNAMRAAINEKPRESRPPDLGKEDIVEAVREAWENYKPDIEVQQFGLEREELLACLKEGIRQYAPQDTSRRIEGASREEVFAAVVEGLKHFSPPRVETEPNLSREEILDAVRECLEEFEFPAAPAPEPREPEITRDDMLDAVKEGLHTFDFTASTTALSRDIVPTVTRDDMLDAVKEGLHTFDFAASTTALSRDIVPTVTREDMLDAVKEGLHTFEFPDVPSTRDIIEGSISRDDVLDAVKEGLHTFEFPDVPSARDIIDGSLSRDDVLDAVKEGLLTTDLSANTTTLSRDIIPSVTRNDMLDAVKEGLHTFDFPSIGGVLSRDDVLDAVKEGLLTTDFAGTSTALTRDLATGVTRDDMLDAVKEGLHTFDFPIPTAAPGVEGALCRDDVLDAVNEGLHIFDFPAVAITREDILDAIKEGLYTFDFPPNSTSRDDVLEAVKEGLQGFDFAANSTALTREVQPSLTHGDVLDAVKEGLQIIDLSNSGPNREDLLDAVNEALRNFDFAASSTALTKDVGPSLTHHDVLDAVKEGLQGVDLDNNGPKREDLLDAVNEALRNFDFAANSTALSREVNGAVSREDMLETVKEALQGVDFAANTPNRDDLLDAVNEALRNFDFAANSTALSQENTGAITHDDMLEAVKEALHSFDFAANTTALSRDVGGPLNRSDVFAAVKAGLEEAPLQNDHYSEQILERLQDIMDGMHAEFKAVSDEAKQNVAANGRDTEQLLDATKDGFEKLRTDIESYVSRITDGSDKDEILETMREYLEKLSTDVETLLSKNSDNSIEAVQGELEHLRETMATSLVRGGAAFDKDEFLDALRDGFDGIRADLDRPRDSNESVLSGTGEILDALHDGLTGLRGDVEKLHNKPVDMTVNYEILDTLRAGLEGVRADIDRLRENGFGEQQAVAEVNDRAVIAADSLKRNDIENLEVLITQLRIKVEAFESTPPQPAEPAPGSLCKEDLMSVEEKLAHVQESVSGMMNRDLTPDEDSVKREDFEAIETLLRNTKAKIDEIDPEQAVKKDHLDAVEALLFETRDQVNDLKLHLEDVTKKDDINMVDGLLRGVVEGLDELKEHIASNEDDLEKVTKTDVGAVEAVCIDIKSAIEQRVLSDLADLASKDDVKNLGELVKEFNRRLDTHADTNAKAFEERQAETVGVSERVTELKSFLEELKNSIKDKLDEGVTSVETLGKFLEGIGETIGQNANVSDDLKELFETMKAEFEKSNAGVVGAKLEADEKFQMTWDKFDAKLDEKFNELMTKYDDAELAAEERAKAGEEKNAEIEVAMLGTKAVAEDLKLLVDTLGTTLTDSVEKMDEASKTVFNRVEETFTRVEETHADAKAEHQLTREQVFKSIGAIEGVQGQVTEYHPKILDSIKDVLLIVGQHYEHSKTSVTTLQEKIAERPPPPEVPLLREPPVEKYDDTPVHEKLDKLVDHMHTAGKSFAQLDMLDKIHQQVMQTAAEVSQFVSAQTQRIADDHEDKEKAVEAATIALEKRLAQKEHVEATVVGLREEEERLKESVSILKAEQEDLAHQKMRLSADVSSLETALRIRREELHTMEARAEGLERRILEGVIDHSRALLLSKSNKGRDAMSRKRVPSHATSTTGSVVSNATSRASYATQSAVNMAMNGNRALVTVPIKNPAGPSRRILSLNQITHNIPTGGMQRSHSVKAPGGSGALRKSSWGGSLSQKYGDLNKENLALKESEEEEASDPGEGSESEAMRRSSRGTTIMTSTGTGMSESVIDEGTEWTGSVDGDDDETEGGDEQDSSTTEEPSGPSQIVLYEEAGQVV